MARSNDEFLPGEILEEERALLSVADLCRLCGVDAQQIEELIDEGVISVIEIGVTERRFGGNALRRTRIALRLQRDLGINLPGVALALELLEELEQLRRERTLPRS